MFRDAGANISGSLGPCDLYFPLGDDATGREIILVESPRPLDVSTRDLNSGIWAPRSEKPPV